jgi:protein-tyrosine phosphatase
MSGVHWIKIPTAGRLAIMARPRAGDWLSEEIAQWKSAGIDVVVSLLEIQEVSDLGLQQEAELCRSGGIEFISFPIPDRGVPVSEVKTEELVSSIIAHISAGRSVAIHCRAGIGRSSVIAACAVVSAGFDADTAFSARARGLHVPDTDEQRDWVSGFVTFVTKGTKAK